MSTRKNTPLIISYYALVACILVALSIRTSYAQIIPASRRITWQGIAGVTGDIPTTRTNCTTAACNTLFGGTVTAATINSALASAPAGTVVRIPSGNFTLTASVVPVAGVTLRGAGMGVTILTGGSTFSGDGIITYPQQSDPYLTGQTSRDLVTPLKDATTITTTAAHGWSAGQYLQIDQLEDITGDPKIQLAGGEGSQPSQSCRNPGVACRPTGQTVKILTVPTSTTATIDTPLFRSYNQSPQATRITDVVVGFGLEDLTVDNSVSTLQKIVHFSSHVEGWMLRVELIWAQTYGLFIYGGYKNTIRSCVFHEGFSGVGGGYMVMLWNRASNLLFEDNITYNTGIIVLMDGSVSGNVFAYNYAASLVYGSNAAGTGYGTHGAHPIMNLFEGNQIEGRFRMDFTWGTSSHGTIYRNKVINDTNTAYDSTRNLVDLWAWASYYNVVGNILGTVGQETIYQETTGPVHQTSKVVYAFGEQSLFGDRGLDSNVALGTVFRQGNWDSVNNAQRFDEDIVSSDHVLPASLYLTAKPAWYGACTWPPFDPSGPTSADIPAKYRYTSSSCPTGGSAPTILRVIR